MDDLRTVTKAEQFTKPGTANVSPADLKKLRPLLEHYRKKAHPFTACYRDQVKHGLSPGHAKRRCAVIKDLIVGNTHWRGKGKGKVTKAADLDGWERLEMEEMMLEGEALVEAFEKAQDLIREGGGGRLAEALDKLIPGDGDFTERVKRYQRSKGLLVDGIVGSQTAAAFLGEKAPVGKLDDSAKSDLKAKAKKKGEKIKKEAEEEAFLMADIDRLDLDGRTWSRIVKTLAVEQERQSLRSQVVGSLAARGEIAKAKAKERPRDINIDSGDVLAEQIAKGVRAYDPKRHPRWPKGTPGLGGQWRPDGMPDSSVKLAATALGRLDKNNETHKAAAKAFNEAAKDVSWENEKDPDGKTRELLRSRVVAPLRGIKQTVPDQARVSALDDQIGRPSGSTKVGSRRATTKDLKGFSDEDLLSHLKKLKEDAVRAGGGQMTDPSVFRTIYKRQREAKAELKRRKIDVPDPYDRSDVDRNKLINEVKDIVGNSKANAIISNVVYEEDAADIDDVIDRGIKRAKKADAKPGHGTFFQDVIAALQAAKKARAGGSDERPPKPR